MQTVEIQILKNQLNAPKLRELTNPTDFRKFMIQAFAKIKILTGAKLYEDEDELNWQVDILIAFVQADERFMSLSTSEFQHAFFLNSQGRFGTPHSHYGREMDAEFIGKILLSYLDYRYKLNQKVPDILAVIEPPEKVSKPVVKMNDKDWQEMIQIDYNLYKNEQYDLLFNITPKYCYLRKLGLIKLRSRSEWNRRLRQALERAEMEVTATKAKTLPQVLDKQRKLKIYQDALFNGKIDVKECRVVVLTLRKLQYLHFLERQLSQKADHIIFPNQ